MNANFQLVRKANLFASRIEQMIPTTFAYCSLVVVGALFEGADPPVGSTELLEATAIGVAAMAVVVWGQWLINDVYDRATDEHSNPDRETTSGAITDREALVVGSLLVSLGLGLTLFRNWYAFGSLVGYVAVNTAYSVPPFRTKSGGLSSMLTLGTMGGLSVLLGATAIDPEMTRLALKLAITVVAFMTLTMSYKDLKDAEHDAKSGVENFVVKLGRERATQFLMVSFPLSYVVGGVLLGVTQPLALGVFLLLGLVAAAVLHFSDTSSVSTLYRIDLVNATYLVSLIAVYASIVG